jgi:hypothetical protein
MSRQKSKPEVTKDAFDFSKYEKASLWSEADLQALCCGLEPDGARPWTEELNKAAEAIRRAVLAEDIPVIAPDDATAGDKLYGHARFFKPAAVIPWASAMFEKFPRFPFQTEEKPLQQRERNTLLVVIAAICSHAKINFREKGMARKISDMTKLVVEKPVSEDTISNVLKQIPEALESRMSSPKHEGES